MDACSPVLVVGALLLLLLGASAPTASAARAFFVFGDSLVDNGNNNYLLTTARADAPPYGIDFPSHRATGRFSNGLNIPDIISNTAIRSMPPFAMNASQFQIGKCISVELELEHNMSGTDAVVSGEHLGAEPALPYLSPELRGAKLLAGANFASAGVGILNDTGVQFVRTTTREINNALRFPSRFYI